MEEWTKKTNDTGEMTQGNEKDNCHYCKRNHANYHHDDRMLKVGVIVF